MNNADAAAQYIPVEFYGPVEVVGRSETMLLLVWAQRQRIIPIWARPEVAEAMNMRLAGDSPRRPDWPDVVWDLVDALDTRIEELRFDTYHQGMFTAQLIISNGRAIDLRPSAGLLLALMRDVPVLVHEDVMRQASLRISPEQAQEFLALEFPVPAQEESSASGDNLADAEFLAFMAQLGADEQEIFSELANDSASDDATPDESAAERDAKREDDEEEF